MYNQVVGVLEQVAISLLVLAVRFFGPFTFGYIAGDALDRDRLAVLVMTLLLISRATRRPSFVMQSAS